MKLSGTLIASVLSFVVLSTAAAKAEERTIAEFKKYVQGKLPGRLSEQQLGKVAKLLDRDQDGKISDEEFGRRMTAIQKVLAGNVAADDSKLDAEPVKTVRIAPLTGSDDADVLLITGSKIAKAWIPFAKWKTTHGKLTRILTVEEIAEDYKAKTIQEKIRLCVRDSIDNHKTKWVILGGDCLPGGRGLVPGGHLTIHQMEPKGIPTDIVYLSPTNWDADGDGIYGEFKDDREAITYPDGRVGLGRIPVRTAADVTAFTEKVIAYESKYPTDQFAARMIYTCTDRPAYPKVRNSWETHLSLHWQGKAQRFFSEETPWDDDGKPGSFPLSADNLVDLINKKETGKLHIHGHGHLPAWVLEDSNFTGKHVRQLKNSQAYPLITTVSCNTGEFDSATDPSIVEQMIRAPKAGSVAVVAPIRTGKPHFADPADFRLMVLKGKLDGTTATMSRYWTYGLGSYVMTTGHAMMMAKAAMVKDALNSPGYHLCICELNLLGDPTLDMRASSPRSATLSCSTKNVDGTLQLEAITDAPESTICLWDSEETYHVAIADENGKATFNIPSNVMTFTLSVSGSSLNSTTTKVTLP